MNLQDPYYLGAFPGLLAFLAGLVVICLVASLIDGKKK